MLKVLGQAEIVEFTKKHSAARKPLRRFLEIAQRAEWPHFVAMKQSLPAVDYAPATGRLIFDIGGNKYRLIARVDFAEQVFYIQSILTHEEYDRENF